MKKDNSEGRSWRGVLGTILCDKVCQLLAVGQWFSPGTPVSSTNKTDRNDITEILLKVGPCNVKSVKKIKDVFTHSNHQDKI
jgi:hypothetical protein